MTRTSSSTPRRRAASRKEVRQTLSPSELLGPFRKSAVHKSYLADFLKVNHRSDNSSSAVASIPLATVTAAADLAVETASDASGSCVRAALFICFIYTNHAHPPSRSLL